MLYVYKPTASRGARELAETITLSGTLARRTRGRQLQALTTNDRIVCWGAHVTLPPGMKALNNVPLINKFTEAQKLATAGVSTVTVSRTQPAVQTARPAWVEPQFPLNAYRGLDTLDGPTAARLQLELGQFLNTRSSARASWERTPATPTEIWLGRKNNHIGGNDLLALQGTPDFYSKKEEIVEEYRLHMFRGKSVRAGVKVPAPERVSRVHPWIRSYDAGWTIRYDNFQSTKPMRKLARAALKALGLDFGAVDMGKKADGSLIVLEVNRAPGLENNTTATYARHIAEWSANPNTAEEVETD